MKCIKLLLPLFLAICTVTKPMDTQEGSLAYSQNQAEKIKQLRQELNDPTIDDQEKAWTHMLLGKISYKELKSLITSNATLQKTTQKAKKATKQFEQAEALSNSPALRAYAQLYQLKIHGITGNKTEPQPKLQNLLNFVFHDKKNSKLSVELLLSFAHFAYDYLEVKPNSWVITQLQELLQRTDISDEQWCVGFMRLYNLLAKANPTTGLVERVRLICKKDDAKNTITQKHAAMYNYLNIRTNKSARNIGLFVLNAYGHYKCQTTQNLQHAILVFEQLHSLIPNDSEIFFYLIKAKIALSQPKGETPDDEKIKASCLEVKPLLEKLIKECPNETLKWKAKFVYAYVLQAIEDPTYYDEFKEIALSKSKSEPLKYKRKSLIHLLYDNKTVNNLQNLQRLLEEAAQYAPTDKEKASWLTKLVQLHRDAKRYEKVETYCKQIMSLEGLPFEARFCTLLHRADNYENLKQRDKQLQSLNQIVTLGEKNKATLTNKEKYYWALACKYSCEWYCTKNKMLPKDTQQAVAMCIKIIEIDSNYPGMQQLKQFASNTLAKAMRS